MRKRDYWWKVVECFSSELEKTLEEVDQGWEVFTILPAMNNAYKIVLRMKAEN